SGGRCDDSGAGSIRRERRLEVVLRAVDVRPGSAVHDRSRVALDECLLDRLGVADVELVVAQRDRLVPDGLSRPRDIASEHAGAACDQDLQWMRISELSPTMNRYALGGEFVSSCVACRPVMTACCGLPVSDQRPPW